VARSPRRAFATACSRSLADHAGNIALLSAGRADTLGGRVSLFGWFIVATACLSPILSFWIASVLGRFLRRRRQSRVLRGGAAVADRPRSGRMDNAVDPE
jgi:hypothetical protein